MGLTNLLSSIITGFAPFLSVLAKTDNGPVVLTGTWFEKTLSVPQLAPRQFANKALAEKQEPTFTTGIKRISPWWQLDGDWVLEDDLKSVIVGAEVAKKLDIAVGDSLMVDYEGKSVTLKAAGIVTTGGFEDNQVFVDLGTAQLLSGRSGQVDLVQVRVSTDNRPLAEIAAGLEKNLNVKARVVSQIAEAEERVLFKIELLMALITLLTVLASGVAVFSTLTSSVLERVKEVGLMKALGAKNSRIAVIFLAEAWAIGLGGGLLGNIVGLGIAQAIARSVFNTYLSLQMPVIPVTLAAALVVATIAALGPVRQALTVDPAVTLRGE